ncbi:hypothetical protein AUP07_0274 [methanogenic archaeon mixed culture ISO4-G1]|nr:hypothetical protein AUP07_0274 [methanogenic archaeon mixed culture ISO4-G1]
MENKNIMIIIAVMLAFEVVIAGVVIYGMVGNGGQEDSYSLYIGLNDSITHEDYDPEEAAGWVDEIVLKYSDGLTRYMANGAYTYDDGTVAHENSLVYVLVGVSIQDIHKICDEAKERLHQSSILITAEKQTSEFY